MKSRLAVIQSAEQSFDDSIDWSELPTLQEKKRVVLAHMAMRITDAELLGKLDAVEEASVDREAATYDSTKRRLDAETEAQTRLSALATEAMTREYEVKMAEEEKEIAEQENARRMVETETVVMNTNAKTERIRAYLQSPNVQRLLAPFCSDGWHCTGDALEKGPMSLKKFVDLGRGIAPLSPAKKSLSRFVRIAQENNDRPIWGVDSTRAFMLPPSFTNIEGEKVNPAIEAQRILREHGQLLIDMGMLRP